MEPRTGIRYGSHHHAKRNDPPPVAWKLLLCVLILGGALLLRYGKQPPIVAAREKIVSVMGQTVDYQDAIQTLGRSFSGKSEEENPGNAIAVFGKTILGLNDEDHAAQPQADAGATNP